MPEDGGQQSRAWDSLLEVAQETARLNAAQVEQQKTMNVKLDALGTALLVVNQALMRGDSDRAVATQDLKQHIDRSKEEVMLELHKTERWWRMFAIFATALVSLFATALGLFIQHTLNALKP